MSLIRVCSAAAVLFCGAMVFAWNAAPEQECGQATCGDAVIVENAKMAAPVVTPEYKGIDPEIIARAAKLDGPTDDATLRLASRFKRIVDGNPYKDTSPPIFCFAPDTSPEAMQRVWDLVPQLNPLLRYQFSDSNRWGGAGFQGDPLTLTWSFVPDGLSVDGGISELFSNLDVKFGSRALWISRVQDCFDRWAALTGTSYVRVTAPGVDWDDGAAWFSPAGPNRGDVRIAMIPIDGGSNVLAYNYFPEVGDMVLDAAEAWGTFSSNSHRFFRNTLMHEHGHGLGFNHVCPIQNKWLMEPFLNTGFDGVQHDDLRAGHRGYGDANEFNNDAASATDVGTVVFGSPITIGAVPPPAITNGSLLSIDGDLDEDWYRFTVIDESTASVTVNPVGLIYDSSPQQCGGQLGNCCFGNIVDTRLAANLNVEIYDSDGTTQLGSAASAGSGESETLSNVTLPGSPGSYYIRVTKQDAGTTPQVYNIDLSVITVGADVSSPQPNPIGFEISPTPVDTTSITMRANEATDATHPIFYQFDFTSGGSGGGPDSLFQESRDYTDNGLLPNRIYNYRVRTRDSAPFPGPNTGAYSAEVPATTHIETPAGVSFGTVTATTVDMMLIPPLPSFYIVGLSGIFFDSEDDGGDTGINEWIQVTNDTATNLTPNTQYAFRARARNRLAVETVNFSPSNSVVTLAQTPAAPDLANPSSISMKIDPQIGANPGYTELTIQCVATSPFDANWDGQFVDAAGMPSAAAVWQPDDVWGNKLVGGMQSSTQYTFVVRARNLDGIETVDGPSASLTTQVPGFCDLLGDIDDSSVVDGGDIAGFLRVKLGVPDGGDQVNCADYGNGDVILDTQACREEIRGG